jgi:hypothetical protein
MGMAHAAPYLVLLILVLPQTGSDIGTCADDAKLTQADSWIRQAPSSWVMSMESATACVFDGTNETFFWHAVADN